MTAFVTDQYPRYQGGMMDGTLMERYLQEKTRTLVDPIYYGNMSSHDFTTSYQPPDPQAWSSQSHTSIGSVALSPPADSDMYDGTQGPKTPERRASSPLYDSKVPFHQWDGLYPQHAQFPLAYIPRFDFINPSDIAPDQHFGTPPPEASNDMTLYLSDNTMALEDDSAIDPELLPDCVEHQAPSRSSKSNRGSGNTRTETATQQDSRSTGTTPSAPLGRSRQHRRTKRATKPHPTQNHTWIKPVESSAAIIRKTEKTLPRDAASGPCTFCGESFQEPIDLQKHIRSAHRRPFTCVFHYAGCTSTFGAKNEWKRHVLSQHLGLHYWHCTLDHCSQANPLHAHGRSPAPGIPPFGSIFNRKDLYTQHVRRMHLGHDGSKKAAQQAEERLKYYQEAARKQRCDLPVYMKCPAEGCHKEFHGANAWDERMEHVACHLGRAASDKEPDVSFGGDHDRTLTDWAASADVGVTVPLAGGGWQHRNPLKGTSGGGGTASSWRAAAASKMAARDAESERSSPNS
ncbi:C2H2 finger domain-containing protein [Sarocladium implicatum]|nr:C2H2 finger domain-containing protein [Sarocladium implicatum]